MKKTKTDQTPDELRDSLLEAALNHVPFDGWTTKTHNQAAKDIGVDPSIIELSFPDGSKDMISLYAKNCDNEMVEKAKKTKLNDLKIRDKITTLVKYRIQAEQAHKEVANRTVAYLGLPQHHYTSIKILYRTVDLMWKTISDTSTDFNYYTKRLTLSAVYTSTFLFWLGDESENNEDTWAFLDRRIENVMKFERFKADCKNKNIKIPDIWRKLGKIRYGN